MQERLGSLSRLVAVVLVCRGASAVLLAQPCIFMGNPWIRLGTVSRMARIVAMMDDNVGHSPFNSFPSMPVFGNCVDVYFTVYHKQINVTVRCKAPYSPLTQRYQCPRYEPGVRWLLANLLYIEYDDHRFELSSCAHFNLTHSYRGRLLLRDAGTTASDDQQFPMWRAKLAQPEMVPFTYSGDCARCCFRNEYFAHMPLQNEELGQLGADPYCVNGTYEPQIASESQRAAHLTGRGMIHVVLLSFAPVLLVGALVVLCKRSATTVNTVAPKQESDKA